MRMRINMPMFNLTNPFSTSKVSDPFWDLLSVQGRKKGRNLYTEASNKELNKGSLWKTQGDKTRVLQ